MSHTIAVYLLVFIKCSDFSEAKPKLQNIVVNTEILSGGFNIT